MPEYDYIKYRCGVSPTTPKGYVWMPIIKIWVVYRGQSHRVGAVVDSGADHTTLPFSLAKPFGIDPTSGIPVTVMSASGPVQNYMHDGFLVKIANHEFHIPVLFSDNLPITLLGRNEIFEYFKVTFDQKRLKVRLDPQR